MEEKEGDYVPPEREKQFTQLTEGSGSEGDGGLGDEVAEQEEMSKEEKKLAASMLPRKRRQLYDRIVRAQKKKASEVRLYYTAVVIVTCIKFVKVRKLKRKRATFDEAKIKKQKLQP